jgi:acyl carrier protein
MSDAEERQAEIERWVIEACQALKLQIGEADDDIFDAGGTSLTIVRLVARAESEFGAEVLSTDEIVESSSVHDIAASIRRNLADATASATDRV